MTREDQLLLDEMQIFCSPAVQALRQAISPGYNPYQRLAAYEMVVDILLARLKKTDIAMQSLTPGGSEYVANPERCVLVAKETRDRYRQMWTEERDKRIDLQRQMKNMVPLNPETEST